MTTTTPAGRKTAVGLGAALAVLALAAGACGSDDAAPQPVSTTETTTGSTAATTTVTEAPTATPPGINSLAAGSGCTPGTSADLPDGEWFGYVLGATEDEVRFDLACWFTGEAAARAASEDGEESPPPNDYYVRNTNEAVRDLATAPTTNVRWLPNPGDPATEETVSYAEWLDGRGSRGHQPGVWLTIGGGAVIEIREQYVP